MNNKRINRISEEVRKVVSEILLNGIKDPRVDPLATVTSVEVTRDLSYANIYISVLGDDKKKNDTIIGLESAKGYIRREIGNRIDLRHVPEPKFHLDETTEHAVELTQLINKVAKEDEENRKKRNE